MRFTIERIRTLVLAAGVLLVVALVAFLAAGKWRGVFTSRELPRRLGINVMQEANGVTYTEAHGGHILFRIHASRAEQLKNDHALLHDVKIEFFSKDGHTIDSISGSDFEYNQKTGIGAAQGPVEITLTRPLPAPASSAASASNQASAVTGADKLPRIPASAGTIHVNASGVTFNQNTGVLTTARKVDFSMARGTGTAVGATYDSQQGFLVLDHAVSLTTMESGRRVTVQAQHAEFERDAQICRLTQATVDDQSGKAGAGYAKILFRGDGSAQRLDATDGFTIESAAGGHVAAPQGWIEFDGHNHPRTGHLWDGVTLASQTADRRLHGSAPVADLRFSPQGELRRVQMSQGVNLQSETTSGAAAQAVRVNRTWQSRAAAVDLRNSGGRLVPTVLHGSGGVVVKTQMQHGNAPPAPSSLGADEVTGSFGPNSELTAITGTGRATLEQSTAGGGRQTASGDRIEARFAPAAHDDKKAAGQSPADVIQSAILEGHVTMVRQPAPTSSTEPQPTLRAAAGRASYDADGQWLHLTRNPRVEDGALDLTAEKIDISQQSEEAFAHGDVKATWMGGAPGQAKNGGADPATEANSVLGGESPAHVVADEAQFSRAASQAVFRGHARLWQQANSIAAPVIVLNRTRQTLVARSSNRKHPVEAVLLSTPAAAGAAGASHRATDGPAAPAVIRVSGAEFTYSDAEHRANMIGGVLGPVVAETGGARCTARKVALQLRPRGTASGGAAEVERVTASGDVEVSSQGRRGVGAQLVYSSLTGEYTLTGTPEERPKLIDPARGSVTGAALIFNSRNDSVSIEGRGRETRTDTTVPR